jgi:transposase
VVVLSTQEGFEMLAGWLERKVHACMEATGVYWESVAEFLTEAGHAVSVINAAQVNAFGSAVLSRTRFSFFSGKRFRSGNLGRSCHASKAPVIIPYAFPFP